MKDTKEEELVLVNSTALQSDLSISSFDRLHWLLTRDCLSYTSLRVGIFMLVFLSYHTVVSYVSSCCSISAFFDHAVYKVYFICCYTFLNYPLCFCILFASCSFFVTRVTLLFRPALFPSSLTICKWASVKLGDTLGMLIWRETINGILCCFGGNTDK